MRILDFSGLNSQSDKYMLFYLLIINFCIDLRFPNFN